MTSQRIASLACACLAGALMTAAALGASAATLSSEALAAKLQDVPVFVLSNADGAPLSASDGTTGVYLDREGAVKALEAFVARQPEIASSAIVAVVPMSQVVRLLSPTSPLRPVFVGAEAERAAADQLKPSTAELGSAAPIFLLRGASGLVVLKKDGAPYVPVFFSAAEARSAMARIESASPGAGLHVEAGALERMLQLLMTSDDPGIGQLHFIPSGSMLEGAAAASMAAAAAAGVAPGRPAAPPPAASAPEPKPATRRIGR